MGEYVSDPNRGYSLWCSPGEGYHPILSLLCVKVPWLQNNVGAPEDDTFVQKDDGLNLHVIAL